MEFSLARDQLDAAELDRWVGPRARPGLAAAVAAFLAGWTGAEHSCERAVRRVNAEGELDCFN